MNQIYECHFFYHDTGVGGYHGWLATIHDNDELIISPHSECCEPVRFLVFMGICQDRDLELEMLTFADGGQAWCFHTEGSQWNAIIWQIGNMMCEVGEAEHVQ